MYFKNFSTMVSDFNSLDELPSTEIMELCSDVYPDILGSVVQQRQDDPNFCHNMLMTHIAATTDNVISSYIPYGIKNELIIASMLYRVGEPDVCHRTYSMVYGRDINEFFDFADFSHAKAKIILAKDGSIPKESVNDILNVIDHYEEFEQYYTQDDFDLMSWLEEDTDNKLITQQTISKIIEKYGNIISARQWLAITYLMEADARAQAIVTKSHTGTLIDSKFQKIDRALQIRYEISKYFNL